MLEKMLYVKILIPSRVISVKLCYSPIRIRRSALSVVYLTYCNDFA